MRRLKAGVLLLALVAAAGLAAAQDPEVNESDFDASVPEADESYLADDAGPVPSEDGAGAKASTPGFGAAFLVLAAVGAAFAAREAARRS